MNRITNAVLKPLAESNYVNPITLWYEQNGKQRSRDFLVVHDTVAIILYNISRKVLLFVQQFRPPVYTVSIPRKDRHGTIDVEKYPTNLGITLELCTGSVDKGLILAEIATEKVFEKCGYKVEPSSFEVVSSYRSGVGRTGSVQTLFYCEVTDDMKVNEGGCMEDKCINVVEMSVPEIKEYMAQKYVLSPASCLYAMCWFLSNKAV